MASTDARPIPRKNAAYRVTFPILDADGDLVTGATGLDSEVSIDGGTFADCTNEATEIATSSGMYYLDLTSSEMNGDTIAIIVKTSSSGAKTTPMVLYPEEAGDIRVDVTMISGDATAADNAESFFDGTGYAGTNNVIPTVTTTTTATNVTTVNGLANNVITAASINADAITAAKIADGAIDAATFAAGAINAAAIAADAITAAKIAADAIGASELAADAVTEIQSGLSTLTAAGVRTAIGLASANLDTQLDALPTAGENADAVWEEAIVDHSGTTGSTAEALGAAGAAGDPWTTSLPGAYGAGSAGKIIGDNINATISSRASQTSVDAVDDFLDTEIAAIKAKTDNLPSDPADASDIATAFSGVNTKLDTIDDLLDTEIGALTTAVDALPTNAELATALGTADDATLAAIAALSIPSANTIADAVLSRGVSNVQDAADTTSLAALILATFESSVSGTTWTIRKTGGSTFVVKTLTTDADAEPVVGVT